MKPPTFAFNAAPNSSDISLSRSSARIAKPTNPQCSPESRVKTEPTWTNTDPSFPTAGALVWPLWGDFEPTRRSQWVLRNAYGKARPSVKGKKR